MRRCPDCVGWRWAGRNGRHAYGSINASHRTDNPHQDPHVRRVGQQEQDQRRPAPRRPQAKNTPLLNQDQRLAWTKELLGGDAGSLPIASPAHCCCSTPNPLVSIVLMRIVALPTAAVVIVTDQTRIPAQPAQPSNRRRHDRQPTAIPRPPCRQAPRTPHHDAEAAHPGHQLARSTQLRAAETSSPRYPLP